MCQTSEEKRRTLKRPTSNAETLHIQSAVVAAVANGGKFFPAHEAAGTSKAATIEIRKREGRSAFADFDPLGC
jgi:hypothetical protein